MRVRRQQNPNSTQDVEQATTSLAATVQRMQYSSASADPSRPPLKSDGRYLIFNRDNGGLNNIRLGWEAAGLLALHTNRTLVLPPAQTYYLIDNMVVKAGQESMSLPQDFIDVQRLKRKIPTMTFGEFYDQEKERFNLPEWMSDYSTTDGRTTDLSADKWLRYMDNNLPRIQGSDVCEFDNYKSDEPLLYARTKTQRDPNNERIAMGCMVWSGLGEPKFTLSGAEWTPTAQAMSLLRDGFVWHPEAYEMAGHVVHKLGLFNYAALHARYNDFQYKDKRVSADDILQNWVGRAMAGDQKKPEEPSSLLETTAANDAAASRGEHALTTFGSFLKPGSKLYMSTDETNPAFFETFRKAGVEIVHYDDIFPEFVDGHMSEHRLRQLKGQMEQLVATYSRFFVGTELSTFTAYIHRMRVYADSPQKELLFNTVRVKPDQEARVRGELDAWDHRGGVASFDREDLNLARFQDWLKRS